MATAVSDDLRRATNPLFNDNRFKLGTFGTNVSNATAVSTIDGVFETTWPNAKRLALAADEAGFEALVPVARWKGFGGKTNFNGRSFETYTWAAALGAVTDRVAVFSTSHVPTIHPIVAAKQATTIDHVTGGRFALNIVCGWFAPELEMFGAPIMDHELRYEYAAEWLEVLRLLWTAEEEFDFQGRFFQIKKGFHEPKPIQKPFPAIMNAGGSSTGRHFAARHCDIAFVHIAHLDFDGAKAQIAELRDLARKEYGRALQIWTHCYVVLGDTEADARAVLDHYARDKADHVAVDNMLKLMGVQMGDRWTPQSIERFRLHYTAGFGGFPTIGTAAQVADTIAMLSRAGLDGAVLSWPRFEAGLARFRAEVLPLLEQAGLRRPVAGRS
jgi:alkanesulfonate monooxygenase SsuD/methylene tetrahydromethanopterin reductase-like flavin-dependent oxidoreductase (luciferase family)